MYDAVDDLIIVGEHSSGRRVQSVALMERASERGDQTSSDASAVIHDERSSRLTRDCSSNNAMFGVREGRKEKMTETKRGEIAEESRDH